MFPLVTVHNPNVKLASAPISVNEDILLVENDVKKLAKYGFGLNNLLINRARVSKDSPDTFAVTFSCLFTQQSAMLLYENVSIYDNTAD